MSKFAFFIAFCGVTGVLSQGCASPGRLIRGAGGELSVNDAIQSIQPGSIVLIGENHGVAEHREIQMSVLTGLRARGFKVSVGMEFLSYPNQEKVDQYLAGSLSEADFLKAISWGKPAYSFYRDQIKFPNPTMGERTVALNAPRALTGHIAKEGLESLTPDERGLLPPDFQLGRSSYKERFLKDMPHLPDGAGERYFAAQSVWDDTMAWKTLQYTKDHSGADDGAQVFVIVVGDFHVQYGGGLPDRILARLQGPGGMDLEQAKAKIVTFSLFNSKGLTPDEINKATGLDPQYGQRANFVWIQDLGKN